MNDVGGLVRTKGLTMSEVDLIGVGLNIPFFYTLCPNMGVDQSSLFYYYCQLQTKKNKNKIKKLGRHRKDDSFSKTPQ